MRYALFADIHGNLEAFSRVLEVYEDQDIDEYVFLGDIVGYGANPNEVTELLKSCSAHCVAGNHDWGVLGKLDMVFFNEYAQKALEWTKENLLPRYRPFLTGWPIEWERDNFICVHGSPQEPDEFHYMFDTTAAEYNFQFFDRQICFVAHTHRPGAYCLKGDMVSMIRPDRIALDGQARYLINVGSVGQPRDRNPQASFCVYDTESSEITLGRVGYSFDETAGKIRAAGLPEVLARRLAEGM